MIFRAGIGWRQVGVGEELIRDGRRLDEERVVTDERDELLAAIDPVLAKHSASTHRQGSELIEDEADGGFLGCHRGAAPRYAGLVA
jgi:hypothetical protein